MGLDIRRHTPWTSDLVERMLLTRRVDTIFDVGANIGQSAEGFRRMGFAGKIVSFEPVSHLFEQLRLKAERDSLWHAENRALGSAEGRMVIHVSGGHAGASSMLEMTSNVTTNAPDQRVVRSEEITVTTLGAMMEKHYPEGDRCLLKLDVQGCEKSVLEGSLDVLGRVVGMKIEMSLVENYKGETLLVEMLPYLYGLGFRAAGFENGWRNDGTGELYQVDCLLFRADAPIYRS